MMENRLKSKWKRGEPTLGAWLTVPSPVVAEIMGSLGFDWLTLDMQHGLIGYEDAVGMLQALAASDVVPLVRVPWNEPGIIGKVLDAGALGIIIPMVNSGQDAEAAVAACRYPPDGRRSFGPIRAALAHGRDYFERANDEVACIPMVETKEALADLEAILGVPGVDAVYVGPNDLSLSLGLPPGAEHEDAVFTDALSKVVERCRHHAVIPGCAGTAALAPKRLDQGFLFVEVSRDGSAMARQSKADLRSVRAAIERLSRARG